jgi:hypothetical protein
MVAAATVGPVGRAASDEAVLRTGLTPAHYAAILLDFFRALPDTGDRADWHLAMARGDETGAEVRVERILAWKGEQRMRLRKATVFGIGIALAVGVSAAASVRPTAVDRDRPAAV